MLPLCQHQSMTQAELSTCLSQSPFGLLRSVKSIQVLKMLSWGQLLFRCSSASFKPLHSHTDTVLMCEEIEVWRYTPHFNG